MRLHRIGAEEQKGVEERSGAVLQNLDRGGEHRSVAVRQSHVGSDTLRVDDLPTRHDVLGDGGGLARIGLDGDELGGREPLRAIQALGGYGTYLGTNHAFRERHERVPLLALGFPRNVVGAADDREILGR